MFDWNWEIEDKLVSDLNEWRKKFSLIHEFIVSPDGEKISAPVELEDKKVTVCINGKTWQDTFERVCFMRFLPDSRIVCLILKNYEWTLSVEETVLEETFDYAWNLQFSDDGHTIAFNIKKGDLYGVCVNGKIWENLFFDARDLFISPDGNRTACYVRTKNPPLLDIFSFKEGVWTAGIDGQAWDKNFLSVYGLTFNRASNKVAAAVRIEQQEFTVSVDGNLWDERFSYVWEPIFINESDVMVPVKLSKGWTMALNGKPIWNKYFVQLWNQRISPDGKKVAAVAAPEFGRWSIVVDGIIWRQTFSQAVLPPVFSPDGAKVAALVRENNKWTVAVDGKPWQEWFDRVWMPQFSPQGNHIAVKAEKEGKFFIVLDGRAGKEIFDMLWDPVFSPDGEKILIRAVSNGKYIRKVCTAGEILG